MAITHFVLCVFLFKIFYVIHFSCIIISVIINLYHNIFITLITSIGILVILFFDNFALHEALSFSNMCHYCFDGRIQKCLITNYTTGFG